MFLFLERRLRALLALADGLLAACSLLLASMICASESLQAWGLLGSTPGSAEAYRVAVLVGIVSPVMLRSCGAYSSHRKRQLRDVLPQLLRGTALGAVFLLATAIAFGSRSLSIGVAGLYAVLQLAALCAQRFAVFRLLPELRKRGHNAGRFVVIGSDQQARRLADELATSPGWRLYNRGFLDDAPTRHDLEILGDRYLGRTKEISDLFSREVIDEVLVALPRQALCEESTAELIALCETVGADVTIVTDLFQTRRARPQPHDLLGVPGISLLNYPHRRLWKLTAKRTIDIVGAMAAILITAPLWLLVALAIKLDSPGPVFFVQRRCGLRGRIFFFLKFRTMHTNAEAQLEELRVLNEATGPVFKMKKDPRVTRVGRVLRRYSIDEFPQFFNVLVGQMSLVGPRPPIPGEVGMYDLSDRRRLSVRPGLTCLWQVGGRSLIAFEDWVRLDLEYIDRWTLWLDFRILLRTLPAMIRGDGAS